jgi:dimethylhistidine N-methyltransferase
VNQSAIAHPHISDELIRAVREGMSLPQKRLPPKFFYDPLGSALFDAICHLPWYPITAAEKHLLARQGGGMLEAFGAPLELVELGPGNGEKLELLALALEKLQPRSHLHLIDISPAALEIARQTLCAIPGVRVTCHEVSYLEGLRALPARDHSERRLALFLGSNLGNHSRDEAAEFLREIRAALHPGDGLLLGVDLVKPEAELRIAYDDPLGVTAAFNKNLLQRLNRELGADFDLARFAHRVQWNGGESRVEMHLASDGAQTVKIPGAQMTVKFSDGETLWTESSYKYEPDSFRRLVESAGFTFRAEWVHEKARFLDALFMV